MDIKNFNINFKGNINGTDKTRMNPFIKCKQDKFQKTESSAETEEIKTYAAPPKKNINFNKKDKMIIGSSIAAIAATIALCVQGVKNGNLQKAINNLEQELNSANSTIRKFQQEITNNVEESYRQSATINEYAGIIGKLRDNLEALSAQSDDIKGLKASWVEKYRNTLLDSPLSYDPIADAPRAAKNGEETYNIVFKKLDGIINPKQKDTFTPSLISKLEAGEDIEIPLIRVKNSPEDIKRASIDTTGPSLFRLGQYESAGMKLNYGKRTNWSDKKVARDIMQNFYDANNYTLDGVGVSIKRADGGYKIRVTGNGVYNCGEMLEMGSGNKLAKSPYNAGGFGEGSRIVVANLLGQGKTSAVKYGSADWQIEFIPKGESIVRKTEKTEEILDGNFIEFTTKDKGFVQSFIESLNFFKNSNNPDFKDLTYESRDFAFKILSPDEKGNLYLTQRFECGAPEKWDESMSGLSLIFNRKPDPEKFKQLCGREFQTGRDRVYITPDDISNLTKYFAQDMSDEDLLQTIIKTQNFWVKNDKTKDAKEMEEFIKSLCSIAQQRNLKIDFRDIKLCEPIRYMSNEAKKYLKGLGYEFSDSSLELSKIGLKTSSEILAQCSEHTPKIPTKAEIQKLKILEEATGALQEGLQTTYAEKLRKLFKDAAPYIKIDKDYKCHTIMEELRKCKKYANEPFIKKYERSFDLTDADTERFQRDFIEFIREKIKTLDYNDEAEIKTLSNAIQNAVLAENNTTRQYKTQLQNLNIISRADVKRPRFIHERINEPGSSTLAEAIIEKKNGYGPGEYMGHWIDRDYLNSGNFYELLATWAHEITHKSGGDGSSEFTYKLTDLIEQIAQSLNNNPITNAKLSALEELFNEIPKNN